MKATAQSRFAAAWLEKHREAQAGAAAAVGSSPQPRGKVCRNCMKSRRWAGLVLRYDGCRLLRIAAGWLRSLPALTRLMPKSVFAPGDRVNCGRAEFATARLVSDSDCTSRSRRWGPILAGLALPERLIWLQTMDSPLKSSQLANAMASGPPQRPFALVTSALGERR